MRLEQLEKFKAWFDDYVSQCYGSDPYVNANLKQKQEHSRRTCSEMLYLAQELDLDAHQKRTAEMISLFHDIGRFPQFLRYRTYNDDRSTNHCLLGLGVLRSRGLLDTLESAERECIEKAIEYHGLRELPAGLNSSCLLFAKLIRDADKLDALRVVTHNYVQYRNNPEQFMLEVEFPDSPGCSPEVVDAIMNGRRIDYTQLRTLNDMKLMFLGWVYDVNFVPTLRRIKQRGFLETLLDFLPKTADIDKAGRSIFDFVESRIRQ